MRLKIISIVIYFLFGLVICDLFLVQVIQGQHFYRLSTNNRIRVVPLPGIRGRIRDRNDVILADNRISFDVMIIPQELKNADTLFDYLASVLKVEKRVLLRRFRERKYTPFAPVKVQEDIPKDAAIILEENKFRFPSLFVQENLRRFYPFEKSGSHVLGYVGKINRAKKERLKDYGYGAQDLVGYSGVEEYYDAFMKGEEGGLQIEVNSRGQQVRLLGYRDPTVGQDISLTIDSRIQAIASELLEEKPGAIIMMDMDNGEILSMVSSPEFDPNMFVSNTLKKEARKLFIDEEAPLFNRAISGVYPPGSVFKVPIAIGALDTETIDMDTEFLCQGYFKLGRSRFRCAHTHGTQNLYEGITHSCNVFFYNVGLLLGPEKIENYARMFGLGRLTHVDLPFESVGFLPAPRYHRARHNRPWSKGDTLNLSIGQGDLLVSPLQVVRMMSTVANHGREVQPHIIKAVNGQDVFDYEYERVLAIDDRNVAKVRKALRAVVEDYSGTAHVIDIDGLKISGKTGTAQTSGGKRTHGWFTGYIEESKKRVAFCIFLEHGGSSYRACRLGRRFLTRLRDEEIL